MDLIAQLRKAYRAFILEDERQCQEHEATDCGTDFIICTKGAMWLRDNFFPDGTVMGYSIEDNPQALIGADIYGHDFLLVSKRFIIDFWPRRIQGSNYPIMIDMESEPLVAELYYGCKTKWEALC